MKRLGIFAALAAATTACNDAVQPGPGDLPPVAGVAYVLAPRVEVDDSITVSAAHGTGIAMVGWEARLLDGTLFGADSAAVAGDPATASRDFLLGFQLDRFDLSKQIRVTAFAVTASGERLTSEARAEPAAGLGAGILFSRQGSQLLVTDTVVVVAGVTRALPNGGRIADAAYNRNLNEIYLTNIERDRLEVFQIADTTFDADGIPIGAQPWGIALWPRNQSGVNADTVVVANSGGTNLSVVNVASRTEVRRHALPNFIVQSVQTEIDPATGDIKLSITEFDFSDRPQHVGTFCRVAACTDVYALYSTTPTAAQQMEFPFRGTVRWENLTNATPESHFFWEQAEVAPSPESDTLQVLVDRGPGTTIETVLSAACGRTVNLIELGFIDTTFVRNSGNFTHALIGEGGSAVDPAIEFARVVGYDGTDGTATANCTADIQGTMFSGPEIVDLGVSSSARVEDIVVNTATAVQAVGINFNGLTNMFRADSIYIIDEGLRLQGIVGVGGGNPGMDLNFDHTFDARDRGTPGLDPNDRLLFAAGPGPTIEVFDTFFYGQVATIPVRDPIIGPLRGGQLPSGEQVLVGVTSRGVVVVTLPAISNIFPVSGWRQ
jgi:hypothetical protein